jgi:hypothetical protein
MIQQMMKQNEQEDNTTNGKETQKNVGPQV